LLTEEYSSLDREKTAVEQKFEFTELKLKEQIEQLEEGKQKCIEDFGGQKQELEQKQINLEKHLKLAEDKNGVLLEEFENEKSDFEKPNKS